MKTRKKLRRLIQQKIESILESQGSCNVEGVAAQLGAEHRDQELAIRNLTDRPTILRVGTILYSLHETFDQCLSLVPVDGLSEHELALLRPISEFVTRTKIPQQGGADLASALVIRLKASKRIATFGGTTIYRSDVLDRLAEKIEELLSTLRCYTADEIAVFLQFSVGPTAATIDSLIRQGKIFLLDGGRCYSAECERAVINCFRRAKSYNLDEISKCSKIDKSALEPLLAFLGDRKRLVRLANNEYCSVRQHAMQPCAVCGTRTERREPITGVPLHQKCNKSEEYRYITKTTAAKSYGLKSDELQTLGSFEVPNHTIGRPLQCACSCDGRWKKKSHLG